MRCLETTFIVDLAKGDPDARRKVQDLEEAGEPLAVASPTIAEALQGAYFRGGSVLRDTLDVISNLEVLDIDARVASEAGRMGAELLRRGAAVATVDLLIAAAARGRGAILVTRDSAFSRIPDLAVETY